MQCLLPNVVPDELLIHIFEFDCTYITILRSHVLKEFRWCLFRRIVQSNNTKYHNMFVRLF